MPLDWPALTPALTEIRLFGFSSCLGTSGEATTPSWVGSLAASWLFSSRRQAHFLLEPPLAPVLMPNVRAEAGPTAKRQARDADNSLRRFAGLAF